FLSHSTKIQGDGGSTGGVLKFLVVVKQPFVASGCARSLKSKLWDEQRKSSDGTFNRSLAVVKKFPRSAGDCIWPASMWTRKISPIELRARRCQAQRCFQIAPRLALQP